MKLPRTKFMMDARALLVLMALASFVVHVLVNNRYGFHRDELAVLDDAHHLAWGYVAYPPLAPFAARLSLELFGSSLVGARMIAAVVPSLIILLTGLMARQLGGGRLAQVVAALAAGIGPIVLTIGGRIDYITLDFLWWTLLAYAVIWLLKSEDPRVWLVIGAAVGLGLMTKYTMAFLVAGVVVGVLLTGARRYLSSPWLWAGAALALLIFLPNLIWQVQHDFISLDFLSSIHERDLRIGRGEDFLLEQILFSTNIMVIFLWPVGLYFYLVGQGRARYQLIGWMYVIPLVLFMAARGRAYYLAPAYPMLLAGGAVAWERWLAARSHRTARATRGIMWAALAFGGVLAGALSLPIAPVNSDLWDLTSEVHDNFTEQIGWHELVDTVAAVYQDLPVEEQARTGILTGNYGEAGAINLYGPAHHLPTAISGINSYWLRGYGNPPPETVIVLGAERAPLETRFFETCTFAAPITNRYGVENEETEDYPGVIVCRGLRRPWAQLWDDMLHFG